MRINVYAEEITDETEVVTRTVTDGEFGTRTFYGIRMFLKSPQELHHSPEDDDRSAITFWVKWTAKEKNSTDTILRLFDDLQDRLGDVEEMIIDVQRAQES